MQILCHVSILYQCLCELDLGNRPPTQQIETPVVSITMKARIKVFFFFFLVKKKKAGEREREKEGANNTAEVSRRPMTSDYPSRI